MANQLQSAAVLRQQPCKLNPCPTLCYVHVLTTGQGKETWALSKKNLRALDDYFAKEGCLEDLFSNKPSGTINPVYLPQTTPEQHKERVGQKTLSISNLAHHFDPANVEEHPKNNHDHDGVLLWKACNGKKCINSYTGPA